MPKKIRDEPDPEWRRWFVETTIRRLDGARRKTAERISAEIEKDGGRETRVRKKANPEPISTWLTKEVRKFNKNRIADIQIIRTLWKDSVGAEVAGESKVVSFSRGILTIDVFSSALIQELRQFHYESVVKDLRDNWQAATPLLRIKFQPGKRHGG